MIQALRNPKIMRWGFLFFCLLIIPSFVIFYGFSDTPQSTMASTTVITVRTENGTRKLTLPDVERGKEAAVNYYRGVAQQVEGINFQFQGQRIMRDITNGISVRDGAEFAIYRAALDVRLDQLRLMATNEQVSFLLDSDGVTRQQLQQMYGGASEYQIAQYFRGIVRDQLAEAAVTRYARVTMLELWQEFRIAQDRLVLELAEIPIIRDPSLEVADADVQATYDRLVETNSNIVVLPERRVYDFVKLSTPLALAPTPTEEQLLEAWESAPDDDRELMPNAGTEIRQILVPSQGADERARAYVESILSRLNAGESFPQVADAIAREAYLAQSIGNPNLIEPAKDGGLFPNRILESRVAEYGEAWDEFVQNAEPGDLSEIIETPNAFAIVRIESRNPRVKADFEDVRNVLLRRVRNRLNREAAEERSATMADNRERMQKALEETVTLEELAAALEVEISTSAEVPATATVIPELGNLQEGQRVLAELRKGDRSTLIENVGGEVIVLRLKDVLPSAVAPLEGDIRTRVVDQVRLAKAAEAAREKGNAFFAAISDSDSDFAAKAEEQGINVSSIPPFSRAEPPARLQLIRDLETGERLDARRITLRLKEGEARILEGISSVDEPTRIFILRVKRVEQPEVQDFVVALGTTPLEQQLRDVKVLSSIEDFKREVVRRYEPVYNPNFLDPEPRARRR